MVVVLRNKETNSLLQFLHLNIEFKSKIVPCLIDENLEFVFHETLW